MECYGKITVSNWADYQQSSAILWTLITYNTAVGDETAEVETAVAVLRPLKGGLDDLVLAELSLLDSLIDTDNVLPDDTAGANVEMANFGVAHETLGKTDGKGRSLKLTETGGALGQLVHHGGLGGGNGIAVLGGLLGGNTPTINHDYRTIG